MWKKGRITNTRKWQQKHLTTKTKSFNLKQQLFPHCTQENYAGLAIFFSFENRISTFSWVFARQENSPNTTRTTSRNRIWKNFRRQSYHENAIEKKFLIEKMHIHTHKKSQHRQQKIDVIVTRQIPNQTLIWFFVALPHIHREYWSQNSLWTWCNVMKKGRVAGNVQAGCLGRSVEYVENGVTKGVAGYARRNK